MHVNFYATLRQVVGAKMVDIPLPTGSTVRHLLAEILRLYPDLRGELLDESGHLYSHVHIFVSGRDAPFLENGLDSVISPDDTIGVFPAVGGG
ncbi:MAG: MoaD/ThiS family protein [Anaerolineales bacterium]|nr:MoaD/ThiS family protein [Anaerolineales bacterium]